MLNSILLHEREHFTPFTAQLRELCKKQPVMVRLRNDTYQKVIWVEGKEEDERFFKPATNFNFIWCPDGSSITSRDYDIIATEEF